MIYLFGSIVLTAWLTTSFKLFEKYNINIFQTIVFNYITCVLTGSLFNGAFPVHATNIKADWFPWAMGMGVLFVSLFNIIGITAQRNGVSVASVANKLSLIIPVAISVFIARVSTNAFQIIGIVLALVAVVFTSVKKEENKNKKGGLLLPVILFIGSGVLDAIINYVQAKYINAQNENDYLVIGFVSAAAIGVIVLLVQVFTKKQKIEVKNLLAGIAIGIPNYFSIWCLVKFLQQNIWGAANIPVNNMGIVIFSTLVSYLFLKEKLSTKNWIGIALSLLAIALIAIKTNA